MDLECESKSNYTNWEPEKNQWPSSWLLDKSTNLMGSRGNTIAKKPQLQHLRLAIFATRYYHKLPRLQPKPGTQDLNLSFTTEAGV
jgi:hypothetical protein